MNKVTWRQYEVDENETLMSISIKFDTSTEVIKRKNRISDQSEIWMGRVILVPEPKVIEEVRRSPSPDFEDQDPESIGFIKLDAFRLRLCSDRIISLNKINYRNEISGILLVTPSAIMFDPTQNLPELGLIIPINDIKRAALYNVNKNTSDDKISWLQVSSGVTVAYFGVDLNKANPILRCLQKWSSAKHLATPVQRKHRKESESNTADFAVCTDSLELNRNEEFFSEVETEWQIESGEFKDDFEMIRKDDMDPPMVSFMPEMSHTSNILQEQQIINLNNLLPARLIGSKWNLKYSTRLNGTSLKTLIRKCENSETPNLVIIKTTCNSIIGALSSHSIRVSEHFFGSGESFLFRFENHDQPKLDQFKWSGQNSFFVRCDRQTLVFGSSDGSYGIWIEGTLLRGTSRKCKTFDSPVLTKEKDFEIDMVELWDFN